MNKVLAACLTVLLIGAAAHAQTYFTPPGFGVWGQLTVSYDEGDDTVRTGFLLQNRIAALNATRIQRSPCAALKGYNWWTSAVSPASYMNLWCMSTYGDSVGGGSSYDYTAIRFLSNGLTGSTTYTSMLDFRYYPIQTGITANTFQLVTGTASAGFLNSARTEGFELNTNYVYFRTGGNLVWYIDNNRILAPYTNLNGQIGDGTHYVTNVYSRALQIGGVVGSKPTCDSTTRGQFYSVQGAAGASDYTEQCLKASDGTYAWKPITTGDAGDLVYGDGSDGTCTYGANSTLPSDKLCTDVTVSSGYVLNTAGWTIYATGTVTVDGTIRNNGGTASGTTAGTGAPSDGGAASSTTTRFGGSDGGAGVANSVGNNGVQVNSCFAVAQGGACGAGSNAGGTGGTIGITPVGTLRTFAVATTASVNNHADQNGAICGGTGGGSGGSSAVGTSSGAGGGGGGTVHIIARRVVVSSTGVIEANGGNGGDASGAGDGGGGGGGAGGRVIITTARYEKDVSGTVRAVGGSGGAKVNNGVVGTAGANGTVLVYYHVAN